MYKSLLAIRRQLSHVFTLKRILAFSFILFFSFLTITVLKAETASAIPYGAGGYGDCAYGGVCSISLTTSAAVGISLAPTSASVYSIQNDSLVVTTQNPLGYAISLESSSGSSSALINGGNSIAASDGTPSSPQVLAVNTWGYRIDSQANFGAGPTSATINASSSSLSFAGLTLNGFPQSIYSQNVASSGGGDTITIWYGVRANDAIPAGSYQQTVIYTAITTP